MNEKPPKQSRCFALTSIDLLDGAVFITRFDDDTPVYFIKQQILDAILDTDTPEIYFQKQIYFRASSWKALILDGKITRIGYKSAEFCGLAGKIIFVSETWYSEFLSKEYSKNEEAKLFASSNIERAAKQFGYTITAFKGLKNYEQRSFVLQTLEM